MSPFKKRFLNQAEVLEEVQKVGTERGHQLVLLQKKAKLGWCSRAYMHVGVSENEKNFTIFRRRTQPRTLTPHGKCEILRCWRSLTRQ
jgi:hypothetical protein